MRVLVLGLGLLVSGCTNPGDILDQIDAHNEMYTDSDGASESESSTGPNTSSGTGTGMGMGMGTGTGTTGSEVGVDLPGEPELGLMLSSSTEMLDRAGSVVLTADVDGEATSLELRVTLGGIAVDPPFPWPVDEPTFEYKVMSEDLDGELTFTLTAQDEAGQTATDSLQVQVDLPEHGKLDIRLVAPGSTPTRGTSLLLIPGAGTEPDEVLVVGTQNETELLFARVEDNELWMSPAPVAEAMHPTGIVGDGLGNFFVAGYDGDDMILRKYTRFWVVFWELRIPHARANDLVFGPDGKLYAAGVKTSGEDTDATVWVSTESGSVNEFSYSHFSQNNEPLESELHGVVFDGDKPVFAGFAAHPEIQQKPNRGAAFQLSGNTLALRAHQDLPKINEHSGWRALAQTPFGLLTVGWHRAWMEPNHLARAQYGEDFAEEQFAVSWPGEGSKIVWHSAGYSVVVGQRVISEEPHPLVHRDFASPYVDDEPGWAHDVLVDRHGFIYFTGEVEREGEAHLMVGRIHP